MFKEPDILVGNFCSVLHSLQVKLNLTLLTPFNVHLEFVITQLSFLHQYYAVQLNQFNTVLLRKL
jgi:hypothetical protein